MTHQSLWFWRILARDLTESGIGVLKRQWLGFTRSEAEIATMQRLKAALDPSGILNPGRVVETAFRRDQLPG
jgi:FAD/FMN-containing dehydrogenase